MVQEMLQLWDQAEWNLYDIFILRAVSVDTIGRDNESISKETKKIIDTKT